MVFCRGAPAKVTTATKKGIYGSGDRNAGAGSFPPGKTATGFIRGGAVETSGSEVRMDLPRGTGYLLGMIIGTGSWVVWATVFDDLVLGFLFAIGVGLTVFGPAFERGTFDQPRPEQGRTVRNLLLAGVAIGVAFVAVLLARLTI